MTVDASRSCLGLATCVGPMARQIVVARVLLTAPAPSLARKQHVGWFAGASLCCDSAVSPDQPAVTGTCRAMAPTKPASSRAIAAVTRLAGLPVRASLR